MAALASLLPRLPRPIRDALQRVHQIDRYIIVEIAKPFFGTSLLFLFLLLMFQILRLADFLIVHHAPLGIVAQLAVFMLISISSYIVPIAFLASSLIAFGRLSSDSELVAMKACGASMRRISRPAIGMSLAASALALLMTLVLGPFGERSFNELLARTSNTQVTAVLKEGMFNSGFFDLLLFAEKIDTDKGKLSRVFIYDEREKNFPIVVVAREGKIQSLTSSSSLGGQVLLKLYNGNTYQLDPRSETSQVGGFDEYELYLKVEEAAGFHFSEPRMLTLPQLIETIRQTDPHSLRHRDCQTEIWKRLSLSLAPIFFCFLGIGLGTVRTRAVQSRGVILTLITVAVYWQTLVYASTRTLEGAWPAWIGMQLPNLIIAAAAWFFYRRVLW